MTYSKEKDFQAAVLQLAKLRGWRTAHFGNTVKIVRRGDGYKTIADKGAAGFPDLVLVRKARLIFAELKLDKGRLEQSQKEWLEALEQAGMVVYVWRPRDWDEIQIALA